MPLANLAQTSLFLNYCWYILTAAQMQRVGDWRNPSMVWYWFNGFAVLFQVVTLPVEFDASKRAMNQIEELNIVNSKEYRHAKKVSNAAAMTYVAATAVAVAELLRFIMIARNLVTKTTFRSFFLLERFISFIEMTSL